MKAKRLPPELIIIAAASLLFFPFLGAAHLFDWDEVNFAEAAREMLITKQYFIPQINFEPFWQKPPLFFWLQVLSMKAFGVNEFAARFPNAVCGIVTLLVLFRIGKKWMGEQFGWIWVLIYAASLLPQLYFKSAIIDPWFNLFIFLSIYYLMRYSNDAASPRTRMILLSGLFAGLAMMTKGPVALLVVGLSYGVHALLNRFRDFIRIRDILLFCLLAASIGSTWFLALWLHGDGHIIGEFMAYQVTLFRTEDASHGGPFFYHFAVLLIGCFPASALSILAMRRYGKEPGTVPRFFYRWMMILFWVVLILFTIVRTKIVHYSSLCYFPLTFLAAAGFYQLYQKGAVMPRPEKWIQAVTGFLLALAMILITLVQSSSNWLIREGWVKDAFTAASLRDGIVWPAAAIIPGMLLLLGWLFFLFRSPRNGNRALMVLFISSLAAFNIATIVLVPRIETYSQGAAVAFYRQHRNEAALIITLNFKSYAPFFYAERKPWLGKQLEDSVLRLNAHPEIPVYAVGKIQNQEQDQRADPRLELLYAKSGFVFYRVNRGAGLH